MRFAALPLFTCILAACGPTPPAEESSQAAIAVMAEIRPGTPLDSMLFLLDRHLVNAMAGQMESEALDEFRRAEAITDRLLEARMPFEWITAEQYSLESKLRQIQSGADRVNAQVRTGVPRIQMLQDLRSLRSDVARLRQTIAGGGTTAPVPVSQLLSGDTAAGIVRPMDVTGQPDNPAGPRPLGTPVRTDGAPN